MDIHSLRTFLNVCDAGGFAPVARSAGLAPSSVSRAMAALEAELGVRLFHRSTRQLTLTDAGEALKLRAGDLIAELEAIQAQMSQTQAKPEGRVRLSASASYGQHVLLPLLPRFQDRYPDIRLDLQLTDARVNLIEDRIDLALRHGPLDEASLICRRLRSVRYHAVASSDYLESAGEINKPGDLSGHAIITFPLEGFGTQWTFQKGKKTERVPVSPCMTISNALALRRAAETGMGVSLLADWTVENAIKRERLINLLPDWEISAGRTDPAIWLIYLSRKHQPAAVRAVRDFLIEALAE